MTSPSYPAVYDPATKKLHPLGDRGEFMVGRSDTAALTVADPTCSRQQFRILRVKAQHFVEPLSATSPTYLNGQPVGVMTPIRHQDVLQAGQQQFTFLETEPRAASPRPTPARRAVLDAPTVLPTDSSPWPDEAEIPFAEEAAAFPTVLVLFSGTGLMVLGLAVLWAFAVVFVSNPNPTSKYDTSKYRGTLGSSRSKL